MTMPASKYICPALSYSALRSLTSVACPALSTMASASGSTRPKVEATVFCEEDLGLVLRMSGVRARDREQQVGRVWVVLQGVSSAGGQHVSGCLDADQRQLRDHQVGDAAVARVRTMEANDQIDRAMLGDRGFRCLEVSWETDRIHRVEHHVWINRF